MASEFDQTEFVDTDFTPSKQADEGQRRTTSLQSQRPLSREELESRVGEAQQKLLELKRAQEELERERAALEEARRRRVEYQNGREEMLVHLTRGIGLLEEAEFNARRDAEQMSRALVDLRDALNKVQGLNEELWSQENWNSELTKALTTLENARMEWNSARMKFTLLNGEGSAPLRDASGSRKLAGNLGEMTVTELTRIGFALTWPLVAVGALLLVAIVLLIFKQ
jgi:chromosome segregation ATPase